MELKSEEGEASDGLSLILILFTCQGSLQLAVAEGGPSITETEATSLAGSRASTSRLERLEREREREREGGPPELNM